MSQITQKLGPMMSVHAAGVGAIALVAVAGWLAVVRPSEAQREERRRLIGELAEAEPRLAALEAELQGVRARAASAEARLNESHDRLGGVGLRNERVTGLTELADECGLRVDRMQPGEVARDGLYLVMPIRIEGEGSYPECARFLSELLTRFSDMSAESFSLDARGSAGPRRATFGFDLVWYADPAGAGAVASPGSVDG